MSRQTKIAWDSTGASHHLGYEIQTFYGLLPLLEAENKRRHLGGAPTTQGNAYVESFAIHFRNLLDFFFARNSSQPNDITVNKFFVEQTHLWLVPSISIFEKDTNALQEFRDRCDREIAHLTLHRLHVPLSKKGWDCGTIETEITILLKAFRNQVPDLSRLDPLLQTELARL